MSGSMEIELLNQPESDRQPFEFKARDKIEMAAFRESCKKRNSYILGCRLLQNDRRTV